MTLAAGASCLVLACGGQLKQFGLQRDKTIVIGFRILRDAAETPSIIGRKIPADAFEKQPRKWISVLTSKRPTTS